MVLAEFGTGQILWSVFWLLIAVFGDIFRDPELSGWGEAGWSVFMIVAPYLGIFVYLIARGHGMSERAVAQQQAKQAQFESYVR
jgi:hypothetical protein